MGKFNGFSGDYNSQPDNISVSNLNFILTGSEKVKQTSTRSYNGPGFSQIIAYILWGISAFVGISVFVTMISKNSTIFASAGAAIGAAAPGLLLGNRIYNS